MSKIIRRFMVVLALTGWAGSASAALLPPVTVGGTSWLQPLDFVNNTTWGDINTVCNAVTGACNGSLGGNDLTGWTWASISDVNVLFNHYIGSPVLSPDTFGYYASMGVDWLSAMQADGFLETFNYPGSPDIPAWSTIGGFHRTTIGDGQVYTRALTTNAQHSEVVTGVSTGTNNTQIYNGAWFLQGDISTLAGVPAAVPITDTLALVAFGLCALGFTKRYT
jgi:hypothetical protein